jgi:hypothetical protein
MSITSLFGKRDHNYKFVFGDGKSMTPSEFGKVALRWSLAFGEQFMKDYFEPGKPGQQLSGGALIDANPSPAHVYVTIMYLAATYVYVDAVLHAPESVSAQVRAAVNDGLTRMQFPQGDFPDQRMITHLHSVIESMFIAIIRDMKNEEARDPEAFNPQPLEATEHLCALLKNAYAWDRTDVPFLGHTPDQIHLALQLQRAMDDVPIGLMVTLKDSTQIKLQEA